MRAAAFAALAIVAGALALPAFAQGGPRAGPKATAGLFNEVEAVDREFFAAIFDTCDLAVLGGLLTRDVEMYHDKGGLTSTSSAQLVGVIDGVCKRQRAGEDYRARREIVPGTMKVYPLNNYGAIQVGEHRFYQLAPGKPEKLVEVAKFTQVWKREASGWKLARILSYDHQLAEAPPR